MLPHTHTTTNYRLQGKEILLQARVHFPKIYLQYQGSKNQHAETVLQEKLLERSFLPLLAEMAG